MKIIKIKGKAIFFGENLDMYQGTGPIFKIDVFSAGCPVCNDLDNLY
jgi:hypothetical protein